MIEYALRDIDANELVLNGAAIAEPAQSSFQLGADGFEYENRIVENSALPGSVKLGKTRLRQREMVVTFDRAHPDLDDFRAADNLVLEFLRRAILLVDKTNGRQVSIAVAAYNISYERGARLHSSVNEVRLVFLEPFWEAITPDNVAQSLSAGVSTIPLTNNGFLPTPPILTFTAPAVAAITQLQVYIDDTKEGIQIDDSLFGTVGYDTLVIDCREGTLMLETFDRTQSILPGTGYFEIPVGSSSLKIDASADVDLDMDFNKRYFI